MSQDPYQAPLVEPAASLKPAKQYEYRPTTILANLLTASLLLFLICSASMGIAEGIAIETIPEWSNVDSDLSDTALAMVLFMLLMAAGFLLSFIGSAVLFLMWMFRSTKNAHTFRPQEVNATPGWAIAYWFIPFVNLFKPYQAVVEIYRASYPDDSKDWTQVAVPAIIPFWWFCWIVSTILGRIETRLEFQEVDLGEATIPLLIGSTLLSCCSALFAILVVRRVTWAQQTRAQRLRAAFANEPSFLTPTEVPDVVKETSLSRRF